MNKTNIKDIRKEIEKELLTLSYKHDNEITLAIDDIVKLFSKHTSKILDDILKNGHGGGNWRRLIMLKKEK